jgi:phosphoglycerate dehydrogenase-like enzyme
MGIRMQIAILDDDHVTRLVRYALAGPGEAVEAFVRDFFAPEDVDPARVFALGRGLHAQDGVAVLPPGRDSSRGGEAMVAIFRRGVVDRAFFAANPKLMLVQRIGERSDGIDVAAAAERGVAVSCLPRRTLYYAAEHAIMMMLALAKRLVVADAAVRAPMGSRAREAGRWRGL